MTKPEGIPEDVLVAARERFAEWCGWASDKKYDPAAEEMVASVRSGSLDEMPMLKIAQIAILAERNRAADVAESWAGTERRLAIRTEYNDEATSHMLCADLAIDIAEHIRSPRSPHNPKDAQ